MKTVIYSPKAAKDLDALPSLVGAQVMDALDGYAVTGIGDVKALIDQPGYRLRVGRYRVIFHEDRVTVLAIEIFKRETTSYRRSRR